MNTFGLDALETEIPHLRRYARALTRDASRADDLVQDCLERGISRSQQFTAGTNLRSWLFTIMHNVHIDNCRKQKRRGETVPVEDWQSGMAVEARQDWIMELRDFLNCFNQLKADERHILKLIAIDGLQYEEVAERLGIATGTVKSRLFRARRKLRELETNTASRRPGDRDAAAASELLAPM
ncbi:sigma-70 family RNA polymerase sigma factor [Tepidicaulis sp. LMO-SS28]|uniref:sigma-70 family RNA polymerase sigma factor n=1 Tax=Tepidicaulis sp. LMO-SS28 TaxID=3447455 RepID=UPI003EE08C11